MSHFDAHGRLLQSRNGPLAHEAARGAVSPPFAFPLGRDAMRTFDRLGIEDFNLSVQREPYEACIGDDGVRFPSLRPNSTIAFQLGPCRLDGDEALIAAAILFSNPREIGER